MNASPTVWLVGNYDGVHRGHQALIDEARGIAAGGPVGLLTFEPHPRAFFNPDTPPFSLTPWLEREVLLRAHGVSHLVVQPFDETFAALSPDSFVRNVLMAACGAARVVVGEGFCFGAGRRGTVDTLRGLMGPEAVCVLPPVRDRKGVAYTSSRVRAALRKGDMAEAHHVLGRPWSITGRVEQGDQRGRLIGFPTANIRFGGVLCPHAGAYLVSVDGLGAGVANVGVHPTVGARQTPLLEVHLLRPPGDLYGQGLTVHFHRFLRPEQRFEDVSALQRQIARDVQAARDWQEARESAMQDS